MNSSLTMAESAERVMIPSGSNGMPELSCRLPGWGEAKEITFPTGT